MDLPRTQSEVPLKTKSTLQESALSPLTTVDRLSTMVNRSLSERWGCLDLERFLRNLPLYRIPLISGIPESGRFRLLAGFPRAELGYFSPERSNKKKRALELRRSQLGHSPTVLHHGAGGECPDYRESIHSVAVFHLSSSNPIGRFGLGGGGAIN